MRFNYFIKRDKHLLDPEEILLDHNTKNSIEFQLEKLEKPISPFLIRIILLIGLGLIFLIAGRSFALQVIKGQDYQQRADNNRIRFSIINAPRGIIYDRFNNPLVYNSPSFSLVMVPLDLPSPEEKEILIDQIVNNFQLDKDEINNILAREENRYSIIPILLKSNLTMEEVRQFETQFPQNSGFEVITDNSRHYPFEEQFAHVVGFIGRISSQDQDQYQEYPLNSMVGKQGLEAYYEKELQGQPGKKLVEIDAHNNIKQSLGSVDPQKGNDIYTTIDKDLQEVLYNSLRKRMEVLGIKGTTGIALNPKTGEVLALVSLPSFDPNVITQGSPSSAIDNYLHSSSYPLFNRAVSGLYPPGSVIKPLMGLAALEENVIDPDYQMHTDGKLVVVSPYDPEQKYIFNDWQNNGIVDMRRAIAMSCNVYFWAVGGGWNDIKGLGLAKIRKYWKYFNLDKKLGIDLPGEKLAILPGEDWLRKNRPSDPTWKLGDTYNISIGEGGLSLTPLEMAAYISTIANDGVLMKPHLLKTEEPEMLTHLKVSSQNLKIIQEGMRDVITDGTASSLSSLPFSLAGKSGSPKFVYKGKIGYHAIFAAYAPYEDPEIVLVVLAENPPEGHVITLPIIKEVLNWYWENRIQNNKEIIINDD